MCTLLLIAATVRSFAHMPLGISDRNIGHLLHLGLILPSNANARRLNRDTHLYTSNNISSLYLTTTTYVRRSGRITNGMLSGRTAPQDSACLSPTPAPPGMTLPRRASVRLNRLRTGVGSFRSCLYKWGMISSAVCECGAEEQTFDHVVLQCPINRPPHGLHGLTVLGNETI